MHAEGLSRIIYLPTLHSVDSSSRFPRTAQTDTHKVTDATDGATDASTSAVHVGSATTGSILIVNDAFIIKLEFHDSDTDTDILAGILADTSDARFPEVIPVASSTTRRHSRDDPRQDVGEEVRVGVGVGAVECQL